MTREAPPPEPRDPPHLDTIPPAPPGTRPPLIHARRLSKYFMRSASGRQEPDVVRAVEGVSLYVRRGETLALMGESGCGKSTLLHTLFRLHDPDYGRIEFDGVDLLTLPARELRRLRRRFQLVLQEPSAALPPDRSVAWAIAQGLKAHGIASRDEQRAIARRWLERLGLETELLGRRLGELSSGERQRVLIARSLALDPEFVAFDEPLAFLDEAWKTELSKLMIELSQTRQTAFLLVTRHLGVVRRASQRLAVMYAGALVESGPTGSVLDRPRHPYTQALLAANPEGEFGGPHPASGCSFRPRCPKAGRGCDTLLPGWVEVGLDHQRVTCWFPGV